MNIAFINPFRESVLQVLETMANVQVTPGRPTLKEDAVARGDVTGLIGMTSEQAHGSLAISFTQSAILDITTRMLGDKLSDINETVIDLVGELTNIVTGGAKRLLSEKGYDFDLAVPAVVSGKGHLINHKAKGAKIIIPFGMSSGNFFVEVCFQDTSPAKH
jgi:chemotaxis protein CheX